MVKKYALFAGLTIMIGLIVLLDSLIQYQITALAQIPTGSIPTVTGSPVNATIVVLNSDQGFANVRSGPGTLDYEIVGVLVSGQEAPALGRTVVGDWIMIAYPGVPGGVAWILRDLVDLRGTVPIVEPPATPTPKTTPTIDPTLAAQFLVVEAPPRLPTFTAPAPIVIPTFLPESQITGVSRFPVGLLIVGLAIIGLFGFILSLLRGR